MRCGFHSGCRWWWWTWHGLGKIAAVGAAAVQAAVCIILETFAILLEAKGLATLATKLVDAGSAVGLTISGAAHVRASLHAIMWRWGRCVVVTVPVMVWRLTRRRREAMLRGSTVDLRAWCRVGRMVVRSWWRWRRMVHPTIRRRSWRFVGTELVLKG